MKTGQEIRASYTDEDRTHLGIVGEWPVPGTRDDFVMQYRYPSRHHDDLAALDGLHTDDRALFRTQHPEDCASSAEFVHPA